MHPKKIRKRKNLRGARSEVTGNNLYLLINYILFYICDLLKSVGPRLSKTIHNRKIQRTLHKKRPTFTSISGDSFPKKSLEFSTLHTSQALRFTQPTVIGYDLLFKIRYRTVFVTKVVYFLPEGCN